MSKKNLVCLFSILLLCFGASHNAEAKKRKHHRRHYSGPAPTHPVVLWARTLSEGTDREQRKIAAFKLSQYSQNIYQEPVVNTLVKCMKDTDVQIRVLCTKAMGRAGTQSQSDWIRRLLLEQYRTDPTTRNTVVRAFVTRGDSTPLVHDTFLEAAKKTKDQEEQLVLMSYFETFGSGSDRFVDTLVEIYNKTEDVKLKRAIVKALGSRSQGQDAVVAILAQCSDSKDTPLALTCLGGLQLQAKKDSRAWSAVEKSIESTDPDVLMATLDVINALPESANSKISTRLVTMIEETDDAELQEKGVLALGVCGDQSEIIVKTLVKLLEDKETDEGVRIAAGLMLGKQAAAFPALAGESLSRCSAHGTSQGLRTACQLGQQELSTRAKTVVAKTPPAPSPSPAPTPKATVQTSPSPSPRVPNDATTNAVRAEASTTTTAAKPAPTPSADDDLESASDAAAVGNDAKDGTPAK